MKLALVVSLIALAAPSFADPFYQHAVLTPSAIQGELFVGAIKTNAGVSEETALPIFYHNAAPTDPWYEPSHSLLSVGYSAGGGMAFANVGPTLDVGPQLTYGIEWLASAASSSFGASTKAFFNCSALANACGQLSVGVMANGTFEQNGLMTHTWHEFGAHPVAYFFGPTITFK